MVFSKSKYRGYGRRRKGQSRGRLILTLALGSGAIYYFFLRGPKTAEDQPQPEPVAAETRPAQQPAAGNTVQPVSNLNSPEVAGSALSTNNPQITIGQSGGMHSLSATAATDIREPKQVENKVQPANPSLNFLTGDSKPAEQVQQQPAAAPKRILAQGIPGSVKVINTVNSISIEDNPFLSSSKLIPRPANQDRTTPVQLSALVEKGIDLMSDGKHIAGREVLTNLLIRNGDMLSNRDAFDVRQVLMDVNRELLFSNYILEGDPIIKKYKVKPGEMYGMIARRHGLTATFLEELNGIPAKRLPAGRNIKVLNGPFHAVVDKSDYRMDFYLKGTDNKPVYVRSFAVGLGENNSTPVGTWVVRPNSKVQNPSWRNPRTGEYFMPNDPNNPIGDYWMGLKGTDANTSQMQSYGIHGTNDPDSIGKQRSMGCVRMRDDDVRLVYHMLISGKSTVIIRD